MWMRSGAGESHAVSWISAPLGRDLQGMLGHMWVSSPLQGEAGPPGLPGSPVSVQLRWGEGWS